MENNYLDKLNESQILSVKDTEGAVLVIAGAGSGKTRVLTSRIAYIVNELKVNPSNILAITFTNKAADEMRDRLEKMIDDVSSMWVCTIHSMCVRILRANIDSLGYNKNFSIYSEDDKDRVLKRIISEGGYRDELLKSAKNHISMAKNDDLSPREYKEEHFKTPNIGEICEIFIKYEEELKKSNALDFDDLLLKAYELLETSTEVREYYANKFLYIHIDEFQDTNTIQYKIAKMLSSVNGNIFVVGDDDQSIYGWRGAKISNILGFERDFRGAKVYKLEQNYRSTTKILDLANTVIKNNTMRKDKTLWTGNGVGESPECYVGNDELAEASYTVLKIKQMIQQGASAKDFAVLMRINALSRSYEQEFIKYNIPFKVYGGFKFFDRKEIKDLTAYLRIIVNPLDNEAILRVINVPRRGIGEKSINALIEYAESNNLSVFDAVMDYSYLSLSSSAQSKIGDFKNIIYELMLEYQNNGIKDILQKVIYKTGFLNQFLENTEENESKRMNIDELINSVDEYISGNKNPTLEEYLSSITLSSDTDAINDGNYVTIATIHAVKGLEYENVFIAGLDETVFPINRASQSEEEMEEERRLMYVAITRAKKRLFLTRARSRYLYGNRTVTVQSRFLSELSEKLHISAPSSSYSRANYYESSERTRRRSDYGYESDVLPSNNPSYGTTKSFSSGYKLNAGVKNSASVSSKDYSKYKCGVKVRHPKFGTGTIISVKNSGDNTLVDIAFIGMGIKTLAVKYAPLEIL